MGLEYKLTNIKNYKEVCFTPEGLLKTKTQAIIHAMMCLGLEGQITEKNLDEAKRQMAVLQLVVGPLMGDAVTPTLVTDADVEAHVGLWTNCFSPAINTKAGFKKFIANYLADSEHVHRRLKDLYEVRRPHEEAA